MQKAFKECLLLTEMFGKKTCRECNEDVSKKYDFCPYCGNSFGKKKKEDYGMLGEDDEMEMQQNPFESMLGGIGGSMFNKMLGGTMKMLEKELEKEFRNQNQNLGQNTNQHPHSHPKTNFEIIINGKRINPENIRFSQKIMQPVEESSKQKKKTTIKMSSESLKKISKLPKILYPKLPQ